MMELKQYESYIQHGIELAITYFPKLMLALFTLIMGLWLINLFIRFLNATFEKREVDPTLTPFIKGIIRIVLKVMLFIMVASMIGIETSSLIAMLGAASLAIGLALQGSLANFAGGVIILILRPFKAGQYIQTNDWEGSVEGIQLFYTVIKTPQGQKITVPNGSLSNGTIKNISHYEERRIDMLFGISYSSNLKTAKQLLEKTISSHPLILQNAENKVFVEELADNGIKIRVWAWTKTDDYWKVIWEVREKIAIVFMENDIEMQLSEHPIPRK